MVASERDDKAAPGEVGADQPAFRILPRIVPGQNDFFWSSGSDGLLRFLRCSACRFILHPPSPRCPMCLSKDLAPSPVSGRGSIYSFTVDHQPWIPGFDPPYVIAMVELDDQPGLRILSNVIDCRIDAVNIGMVVNVDFQRYEDRGGVVWVPVFRPRMPDAAGMREVNGMPGTGSTLDRADMRDTTNAGSGA